MRFWLALLPDGAIEITGRSHSEEMNTHFRNEITKGHGSFGLPYAELIQYAWIETNDDGSFADGGKRQTAGPSWPAEIPPFLRKNP